MTNLRQLHPRDNQTVQACACIGPQNGEPFCPCRMHVEAHAAAILWPPAKDAGVARPAVKRRESIMPDDDGLVVLNLATLEAEIERLKPKWQPIATAPEGERVLLAGYQSKHGNVAGYWWWREGMIWGGVDPDTPDATHWCHINLPIAWPDGEK